jgi:hypothetical protein
MEMHCFPEYIIIDLSSLQFLVSSESISLKLWDIVILLLEYLVPTFSGLNQSRHFSRSLHFDLLLLHILHYLLPPTSPMNRTSLISP